MRFDLSRPRRRPKHALGFLSPERPTRELLYRNLKNEIASLNTERRRKGLKDPRLPDEDYLRLQITKLAPFVVPVEEVERFGQQYVSLFALAKQQGRHHLAVKKKLEAAGMKPALDPEKIGATFYRRGYLGRE